MNKWFSDFFRSPVKIRIKGKNVERFIRKLISKKVDLLELNYINYKEVIIKIYNDDYQKVLDIKTIYEIEELNQSGIIKVKKILSLNKILIGVLVLGITVLIFLSNIIFKVEVIDNNKEIRELIERELKSRGINKFHFVKSYDKVEKIKEDILKKYRDQIEWLEIERIGTKYQIRLEQRKITSKKKETEVRNIVAKKSAIIKRIEADEGDILKSLNDYVDKGDIIISGSINLNEEEKSIVRASGVVYGEVWYKVTTEMPLKYRQIKHLNNYKNVFVIEFLNHNIDLTINPFENREAKIKTISKHHILPIRFTYQKQEEIDVINKTYTPKQALKEVKKIVSKKINSQLNDKEFIIKQKNLKITPKDSKIIVETFVSVYEDITDYKEITEPGDDNV